MTDPNPNSTYYFDLRSSIFNLLLFQEVYEVLNVVGFTPAEQENLFSILAGIIHLGDIRFRGDEASEVENGAVLTRACQQLSIAEDNMELGLTTLVTITRGEEIIRNYKVFSLFQKKYLF